MIRTRNIRPREALRQAHPGFAWDTGLTSTQGIAGLLHGGQVIGGGPASAGMDVDAAVERVQNDPGEPLSTTARWTNLNTFSGRGGKVLFWHGVSDPWFSARESVRYYDELGRDNAETPLRDWSRLFLVPGMGHCGGGARTLDQFDLLSAVVEWVETAHAPEQVIATGKSAPGESRPLCPFPLHAHYDGAGDARAAANYTCRE